MSEAFRTQSGLSSELIRADVAIIQPGMCNSPSLGQPFQSAPITEPFAPTDCTHAIININSGEFAGQRTLLELRPNIPGEPHLEVGDHILLSNNGVNGTTQLAFQDFDRSTSVWLWLGATLVLIAVIGAWRGIRALFGLAITMAAILVFLLPGLAQGGSPVLLALTCGAAVLFLVLFLVHGFSWKTASAMGGTLIALCFAAVFSYLSVRTTGIRGLGDESNLHILVYMPGINISGLMLAGMIVGALGVLNDVAIAQASTVKELHEIEPDATKWHLFTSAMKVGRDHIASMVYTLVLSYTGVALPTLLLLSQSGRPLEQIITSDVMATEMLRSLVGAMALVLTVPITTVIASWTATSSSDSSHAA
ncbi:YibE/F family protein [Corynebacterium sp. 4HC-13]|nr:YibE/F family protein [Corynebacterium anserum]